MSYFQSLCLLLLSCFLSGASLHAQILQSDTLPEEPEFGVIHDSLFHLPVTHDFPFEYLLNKVDVSFSDAGGNIVAFIDHLVRIRVLSDDPVRQAEAALVGIPFYFYDDMERITRIEAITHHPDGERTDLEQEDITTADLNSRYKIREFMMPDTREGSILEYRFRKERRYIEELPPFYFSRRVPVKLAHLTLHNEDYLRYEVIPDNIDFVVEFHEQRIDTSSVPLVFSFQRPEPIVKQHWFAKNVPGLGNPSHVSSMDDIRGRLNLQISEFGRPRQPLENSWELVEAQIRRGDFNPYKRIENLPEAKILGERIGAYFSDKQAARDSIFQFLNRGVVFNEMRSAFPDEDLKKVLEGEPSSQGAINHVLLAMLQGADIDAKPVYVTGWDAGRLNKDFPSIYQFNQMLVYAEGESDSGLMDASFPFSRPGFIPTGAYKETGMLLERHGYSWVDISPDHSLFDLDIGIDAELKPDGTLAGAMNLETAGYPAREIRAELASGRPAQDVLFEIFFELYSDIRFTNIVIREEGKWGYPLRMSIEFEIRNYATSFQEGLQFRPMIVGYLQENPFQTEDRDVPVSLDAPEKLNIHYEIRLPDKFRLNQGYQSSVTGINQASLTEEYASEPGIIRYRFNVDISKRDFSTGEYPELRKLYERWVYLSQDEWFIEER